MADLQQKTDFIDPDALVSLTIREVANALSVSEASVQNWIKTGYLIYSRNHGVTRASFNKFCSDVVGKDKLTKRANKSLVDSHDHGALISKMELALKANSNANDLACEYERNLSNAYRNKEGIYYTPEDVCVEMFSDIPVPQSEHTFCDPCCGSGNFIISAIRHGFQPENIYGYDTDPIAVEITKLRIYQETGYISKNIVCGDFLEISSSFDRPKVKFNGILTNPPWGKKLQKEEKARLGSFLGAGRSLDTSALFLFAASLILEKEGYLSLLMPESFFKIATFQDARRYLLDFNLVNIQDFGKPFTGLLTKAQSFCVINSQYKEGSVQCYSEGGKFTRNQITFQKNPSSIINFESSPEDASVISKFFEKPYVTLKGYSRWGLGIVTGNNEKFCKNSPDDDLMPVYRGVDIHKGWLDKPTTFIPTDLSLYQQVAPAELFEADEKILYRFISSDLVFFHDTNKSYFLNSVNMLIPASDFPVSNENIVRLFNTEIFNWMFKKIFNTHKILRTDLEKMPLPVEFLQGRDIFTEEDLIKYYEL